MIKTLQHLDEFHTCDVFNLKVLDTVTVFIQPHSKIVPGSFNNWGICQEVPRFVSNSVEHYVRSHCVVARVGQDVATFQWISWNADYLTVHVSSPQGCLQCSCTLKDGRYCQVLSNIWLNWHRSSLATSRKKRSYIQSRFVADADDLDAIAPQWNSTLRFSPVNSLETLFMLLHTANSC